MKTSDTITKIADALVKAQAAMKPALKDSRNPHFNSRYADLASVWDAIREPLTSNGLSVIQMVGSNELEKTTLTTRVTHVSGEWIESTWQIPVGKQDPQGLGSAISYARRYALASAIGVVQDDDDGNAAMPRQTQQPECQPKHFSLADACEKLESVTTLEELETEYKKAYREATMSKASTESLTQVKDKVKEKLSLQAYRNVFEHTGSSEVKEVRKYELKSLAKPAKKTETIDEDWK
jgi:hypothetical protein